ncbi:MAG: hypothetical protein M3Y87_24925 [Myxococcota bacterium]|nr:hypothetical protein [Myxococcota bacterium]
MPEPTADPRALALRAAPPLAFLAALAALVDLGLNRVAVRVGAELVEATTVLEWMRFGALPRNLAGVTGIVALLAALGAYLRMPGFAPLYVRLPVAGFAGILMPTFTLALLLPRERMAPHLVLFGMFATNILICLFASVALAYRNRALRLGLALALLTALQALVVVTIASLRALVIGGGFGGPLAYFARHGGELTWLLVPLALVPAVIPRSRSARELPAIVLGVLVLIAVVLLGVAGEQHLHPYYSTVVYGAFRVAALPEAATLLYVLIAAIALGAAASGLAAPDPWRRQLGAGMALWVAGGYAARSPIQLLEAVLGIVLLARVAQAADPEGLRRAATRWRIRAGQASRDPRDVIDRDDDGADAPSPEPSPSPKGDDSGATASADETGEERA